MHGWQFLTLNVKILICSQKSWLEEIPLWQFDALALWVQFCLHSHSLSTLDATFILSMDGRHLCRINFCPRLLFPSLELQGTWITLCCWIGQWLVMTESPCVTKMINIRMNTFWFLFLLLNDIKFLHWIISNCELFSSDIHFSIIQSSHSSYLSLCCSGPESGVDLIFFIWLSPDIKRRKNVKVHP